MYSSLKIDLNGSNEPIIRADVRKTEDLRDKLVCEFFECLSDAEGRKSNLLFVERIEKLEHVFPDFSVCEIHPIPPDQEDKFMRKLSVDQVFRTIPVAFQGLNEEQRKTMIECLKDIDQKLNDMWKGSLVTQYRDYPEPVFDYKQVMINVEYNQQPIELK